MMMLPAGDSGTSHRLPQAGPRWPSEGLQQHESGEIEERGPHIDLMTHVETLQKRIAQVGMDTRAALNNENCPTSSN